MYSKWDNLDDSDDEADNALEKAQALNERGSKLLTGQGKAPQPEAALECFEQACKQLLRDGKPVSSDARDLAGGVMLNMAVAAHELKRHSPVERAVLVAPQLADPVAWDARASGDDGCTHPGETPQLPRPQWPHVVLPFACARVARVAAFNFQAALRKWSPSLQPDAFSLHPYASRRHEKVVTHAAAVLDLEPANAYDRGQAHMWRATGREALGDLRGAIEDLKVCYLVITPMLSSTARCETRSNPSPGQIPSPIPIPIPSPGLNSSPNPSPSPSPSPSLSPRPSPPGVAQA